MWIVQEVANARNVMMQCGSRKLNWNTLSRAKWAAEERLQAHAEDGRLDGICDELLHSLEESMCAAFVEVFLC